MRGWRLTTLALMATLSLPALAAPPKAPPAASKAEAKDQTKALLQFQRDLASVLALRTDAEPLLAAALLARPLPDAPEVLSYHALLERAARNEDAGPAVSWAQLADCSRKSGDCPNVDALTKLEQQAPDNAAVWLLKLAVDDHQGKKDSVRTDLGRAANAKAYDDYLGNSLKALANSVSQLPPPPATFSPLAGAGTAGVQMVLVFGLGSAQPMPGFQVTARFCEDNKSDQGVVDDCLKLAKVLEWGSSPLGRSLGLHLRETLSPDAAQQQGAKTARLNLIWQMQRFAQLNMQGQGDKVTAQKLLALARTGGTEMSVILSALRTYGIPAEAPAGWEPAKAES
ncbi:hypothetical protein EC912_102679 [Luteibacter rhizovicinus]|uniref:Uncharacterized protein n=1 Tax=Luteibacter rhizovicinus TaxID=242606 RepID=A0A4R3YWX8_9GAMM|nr:hypothetical protein [Luteibacter rhizovicinus]TCV96328.1 hypothetical protein EC912_102679 [Luteibacter rhizovicinus]